VRILAVAFGLSMDYELFLLSSIKERSGTVRETTLRRSRSACSAPARSSPTPRCCSAW
jgi:uncharacterized membrane protein YdfJ with MMPL/SSD domain